MSTLDTNGLPRVTVVIETITARYDVQSAGSMADDLAPTLTGLERQSYPRELIEAIVVLDGKVPASAPDEVRRRFPFVAFAESPEMNYYAAKNAGAKAAGGSVVALLDGDCEPEPDWLESLVSALEPGVAAVAGRTRYARATFRARTLSIAGFGSVGAADASSAATGFNLNNVAFDRDVLVAHPFDSRLRRNGGCYLLYHQLRAAGKKVMYEPRAVTAHGTDDIRGWEFLRKHFGRGYDTVTVLRLDERQLLRATRPFLRFGAAALVAITLRRIVVDWRWIARQRSGLGVGGAAVPYYGAVAVGLRLVELAGMIAAVVDPDRYSRSSA
jgi:glycosyltransferase involved in cell wall biosynthesis